MNLYHENNIKQLNSALIQRTKYNVVIGYDRWCTRQVENLAAL